MSKITRSVPWKVKFEHPETSSGESFTCDVKSRFKFSGAEVALDDNMTFVVAKATASAKPGETLSLTVNNVDMVTTRMTSFRAFLRGWVEVPTSIVNDDPKPSDSEGPDDGPLLAIPERK